MAALDQRSFPLKLHSLLDFKQRTIEDPLYINLQHPAATFYYYCNNLLLLHHLLTYYYYYFSVTLRDIILCK